jgi:thiol-disulfide isomerase/thioredoxin
MNSFKLLLGALLAGLVGLPHAAFAQERAPAPSPLPIEGQMASLAGATGWLQSPPLTAAGLRGKVVLVEFWTFSCVNWVRTLPYVRAWADKYRGAGLVVIGVHSPEFEFEKNVDNINRAVADLRVTYPVAIDSDFALWRTFGNQYWPALYVVDAQGRVRHHQFGEGGYERTERVIQQLLAEAGAAAGDRSLAAVSPQGVEVAADGEHLKSPETYVGHGRAERFATRRPVHDKPGVFVVPDRIKLNEWGLAGNWTIERERSRLNAAPGRIAYRFHARDLNLVMGPPGGGGAVRFRLLVDGQPPGDSHGSDVDAQGFGSAKEQRLYQLVRQPGPITDRLFEIEFLDDGIEAFVFTFG